MILNWIIKLIINKNFTEKTTKNKKIMIKLKKITCDKLWLDYEI